MLSLHVKSFHFFPQLRHILHVLELHCTLHMRRTALFPDLITETSGLRLFLKFHEQLDVFLLVIVACQCEDSVAHVRLI